MSIRPYLLFGFSLLWAAIAAAQEICPALEQAAIAQARVWCADVQDGQVCYGNAALSAELHVDDLEFRTPGDRVPVASVNGLTGAKRDNLFGVGFIKAQAYPAVSWQSQAVTMVLLGDVTLTHDEADGLAETAQIGLVGAAQGANIRSGPTREFPVIRPIAVNTLIQVTGRTDDNLWLRVQLPDGETGWIASAIVENIMRDELVVVDLESPTPERIYTRFSSFVLETARLDARCREAPESGLLLQTTTLDSPLRFRINQQEVLLAGTAFLQAQPDAAVTVFVLEGRAQFGETVADAGYQLHIPLALTKLDEPQPLAVAVKYDFARVAPLPMELLPRFTYISIDINTLITPRPEEDVSPLADVLVNEPCVITTGQGGANLRAGPGLGFPIRGVLGFRETARPIGRAIGSDGGNWWQLSQNVWISAATTVTGGDCVVVPRAERIPAPPPPTPQTND